MRHRVEERVQPQHPPEVAQVVPPGQLSQRCHRQRQHQKNHRQQPRRVQHVLHRVGERVVPHIPPHHPCRNQPVDQQNELVKLDVLHKISSSLCLLPTAYCPLPTAYCQKFTFKSIPAYIPATCSPYPLNASVGLRLSPSR